MEVSMENKFQQKTKLVFCPTGDLTAVTLPEIRVQLKELVSRGPQELVIDLVNARVIDSAGIGLLVATYNSLHRLEGAMSLINVSQDLLELLKAFRLDKHFSISGDPRLA